MYKILALVLVVTRVLADEASCPNFTPWTGFSDTCAWFPLNNIRQHVIDTCDISITGDLPEMPVIENLPDKCGHCAFKVRCRKREMIDGCFPMEAEKEVCDEHGDICDMPPFPLHNLGCKYEFAPYYLRQCMSRPDIPDWQREGYRKFADLLPKFHCKDHNGQCKCCCHPYMPNEDGSQCVQHNVPECEAFTDWNDWSEKCLWMPPAELKEDFQSHCDFEMKAPKGASKYMDKFKLPAGFENPERCGYCSFKIKCRKRDMKSTEGKKECFPLDVEKKACGPEDCETCGNVCTMPKLLGSCNYTKHMKKIIGPGLKARMKKIPHSMQMGLMKMISHLPHGKCVEKEGKCKCCCHPYEPNAEGTECVLKSVCKTPEDVGIEFDMNLPEDDTWWMW